MNLLTKITKSFKMVLVLTFLSLYSTIALAQEGGGADIDVKITKDTGNWYAQPWVWVVGGAVFLLLLVALLRGNNNK